MCAISFRAIDVGADAPPAHRAQARPHNQFRQDGREEMSDYRNRQTLCLAVTLG
jgi:hypothetical protein